MPNTFFTAADAAQVSAIIARNDLGAGRLVHRDVENDFVQGRGLTVPVRVPGSTKAYGKSPSNTATSLTIGDMAEQTIDVTLSDHAYSRLVLSEADLSLNLKDFTNQVLRGQAEAVAVRAENALMTAVSTTPVDATVTWSETEPAKAFTAARALLRGNGVPVSDPIQALVGVNAYAALLDAEAFDDEARTTVRTVKVHENSRLDADEIVVFVRQAFALAVRAPIAPEGAPFAASVLTKEGDFALRHVRAYNPDVAAEESLVSTFVGARAMPLPVYNEATGQTDLVENGGAVRIAKAA